MNKDQLATGAGMLLAVLHQVGIVGTVPQTKTDWINTGASAAMILLGFLTNKA